MNDPYVNIEAANCLNKRAPLSNVARQNGCLAVQSAVSVPVMCSDVVVYPYQIYQARLAGADALKLIAPALPDKVSLRGCCYTSII